MAPSITIAMVQRASNIHREALVIGVTVIGFCWMGWECSCCGSTGALMTGDSDVDMAVLAFVVTQTVILAVLSIILNEQDWV